MMYCFPHFSRLLVFFVGLKRQWAESGLIGRSVYWLLAWFLSRWVLRDYSKEETIMNFEKLKEEFRQSVARMNVAVDHNDRNTNLIEYGRLDVLSQILNDMGHTVEGSVVPVESNMHRIIYMTIDGKSLGNFVGNVKNSFYVFSPDAEKETEKTEKTDETEEKD